MVYKWKLPGLYNVPAQKAGTELERIYQEHGRLDASDIVNESRPEAAPLHPCFEWDDSVAAELWRERQARGIVQCIVSVQETKKDSVIQARAFVHVQNTYHPTKVVVSDNDMRDELIRDALRDMETFKRRFSTLSSLQPVIEAMDRAAPKLQREVCNPGKVSYE